MDRYQMKMDRLQLKNAIEQGVEASKCIYLNDELKDTLVELTDACEQHIILVDKLENQTHINFEDMKTVLYDLRNEVESAQATLSDLDDKFGDIYNKLEEVETEVDELECNNE